MDSRKGTFSQWSIVLLIVILLVQPWSTNVRFITSKILLLVNVDCAFVKEVVDFFKYETYSAVLNCRENRALYALAAANNWHMFSSDVTQAFTVLPSTTWV
jgi:hypothetical protein